MLLSAFRIGCLYLLLAWTCSVYFDQTAIFVGALIANIIASATALVVARHYELLRGGG